MTELLQLAPSTSGTPWWGIIVPACIFLIAFCTSIMLYRHFTRDADMNDNQDF